MIIANCTVLCKECCLRQLLVSIQKIMFRCYYNLTAVVPVTGPPLNLTSTSNGNPVYREQEVTFTCTTRGSSILAWSSDHYIGEGSLLEFVATINTQGTSIESAVNNNTVATLIYTNEDEQRFVLQSELRILVLSTHPQSTILCHNVDQSLETNITFCVFGKNYLFC